MMFKEITVFVTLYSWLFSLFTLILGIILGSQLNYWNALRLARRKEFNDVAERVRPILENEMAELSPLGKQPEALDFDLIGHRQRWWRKSSYGKAVLRYKEARKGETQLIEDSLAFEYKDDAPVKDAIAELLDHIKYR